MSTVQLQHNIATGLGILWEPLLFKVFINVFYKYVGVIPIPKPLWEDWNQSGLEELTA